MVGCIQVMSHDGRLDSMNAKHNYRYFSAVFLAAISLQCGLVCFAQHKAPPQTRVDNVTETLHGVTITDPYRWLEDQNSAETRAWINAQNEYTASLLGTLPMRD